MTSEDRGCEMGITEMEWVRMSIYINIPMQLNTQKRDGQRPRTFPFWNLFWNLSEIPIWVAVSLVSVVQFLLRNQSKG
jgi:hypothetical protein